MLKKVRERISNAAFLIWPELMVVLLGIPFAFLAHVTVPEFLTITVMLVCQNATFTMVSRARQSNNLRLHGIFAVFSNGLFIFIITSFVPNYDNLVLKIWYIVCTVVGSVHAHHISMHKIEKHKSFAKDSMVSRRELLEALANIGSEFKDLLEREMERIYYSLAQRDIQVAELPKSYTPVPRTATVPGKPRKPISYPRGRRRQIPGQMTLSLG
jgi:hypothetical protein